MILHNHHIIPKHAGGTNDKENLYPLTIIQHALAHRNRAIIMKDAKDWIAWKTLSGQIGRAEAIILAAKIANSHPMSDEIKRKISKSTTGIKKSAATKQKMRKPKSLDHRENLKKYHADFSGKNNPMFGKTYKPGEHPHYDTMWITNGVEEIRIKKGEIPCGGYERGRSSIVKQSMKKPKRKNI